MLNTPRTKSSMVTKATHVNTSKSIEMLVGHNINVTHLFGLEGDGFQLVSVKDVLSLAPPTLGAPHVPLPHHSEGKMAEGGQVPTRTNGTLVRDE